MLRWILVSLLLGLDINAQATAQENTSHPLNPLSFKERWQVLQIMADAGQLDDDTVFSRMELKPPSKQAVWNWPEQSVATREAELVLSQDGDVAKVVVDLTARKIVSTTPVDAQLTFLEDEFEASDVIDVVEADPRFAEALKARGIKHQRFVSCTIVPYLNFEIDEYSDKRVGVVKCFHNAGARNTWGQIIPGMDILVDLSEDEILEFRDADPTGPAFPNVDFVPSSQNEPKRFSTPINIDQPLGPSFSLNGHIVEWDRWRFHWRMDHKVGTVISTATWNDGEKRRPVLYEGHLSELYVPYMSNHSTFYSAAYFDVGDYSDGGLPDTMVPGRHCPHSAVFQDMVVTGDDGQPSDTRRAGCMFERMTGDALWSYADYAVPKRELVIRFLAQMGNYDYLIDYVFQTDGEIRIVVGATGILLNHAMKKGNETNPESGYQYGRMVDQNVLAVNHSHYFSFRLDIDVDGVENRFVKDRLVRKQLPDDARRDAVWVVDSQVAETEEDGKVVRSRETPAMLRFAHPSKKNSLGYETSYRLTAGHSARTLLEEDDITRQRAGFISNDLWVTPYAADERYAAGEFTTLAEPGEHGLPTWTEENRSILDRDIVAWATIGMHHVPRAEDWPVMPTLQHTISLKPFNFFDANPTSPPM
ncbi:MAG: hypothetical protein ABJ358_04600, partial [Rhizobiaceae bacterium]